MYQQKFTPYNKMNQVYEDEEFEEQDSEPLIEEVDPSYQPNDKEVKQYALDILGMNFPEDERLLYLAKEGLKAPLPPNWQPFQGRDGEVYYKHKITQQKTYQHPTDVEYQKKYIQQKERMARKNLKSMNLKSNPLSNFGQPLGGTPIGLGPKPVVNPLGLSYLSNQSQMLSKQAAKLEQQLERQVEELQVKLKKQYKQFQIQRENLHQKNTKKYKLDFENSLRQIKGQKLHGSSYEQSLKGQKQRIKQNLTSAYEERFKQQSADVERAEQKKLKDFQELFQQDNTIKIKKYETQRQTEYNEKLKKLENSQKTHEQNRKDKQKQRQKTISKIREKLQQEDNREIEQATKETFQKQLDSIKNKNNQKVQQFQEKLNAEFQEMKKLLGYDVNKTLVELAQKRNRLKKMSDQKLESLKKKEYQKINQLFFQQLQKSTKQLESILENQHRKELESHKKLKQSKIQSLKQSLGQQHQESLTKNVQSIYRDLKKSTNEFQKDKNKKILEIREQYIGELLQKTSGKTQQINVKLGIKDKQDMIQNKEELIASLAKQIQLEKLVLKDLQITKSILGSNSIDQELKRLIEEYSIKYKPDVFLKHEKVFNQLKAKFKSDKQLLASMMGQLQTSSFVPFYQRQSQTQIGGTSTTSLLIKNYNKDVRTMRKNQQMLSNYQILLKKSELNDEQSTRQLQLQKFEYEDISLRSSMGLSNGLNNEPKLKQIQNAEEVLGQIKSLYGGNNCYKSVEDSLKEHSKFLTNIKADLNRKLYKVRNNNFYRI